MPLPALRKFENEIERQWRLFELKKSEIERNIGRRIRLFEEKRDGIGKKIEKQIRQFERKRGIRLDDEVRFLRSWIERPLSIGAVTEALVRAGVAPSRLVLVEFNPSFCRILKARYPEATLVQGDAYSLRRLLETLLIQPAAAVVSGLPLVTKPIRMRLRLLRDPFDLMLPGAPFVQFTYSVASPLPRRFGGFSVEASERVWMNIPPARVWVYRRRS